MRIWLLIIISIVTSLHLAAQNLSGIWRGKRTQAQGGCFEEYSLELHILNSGEIMRGIAYNYYDREQFTKINFKARFNPKTGRIVIIEGATLQYNIPSNCIPCIKTYDLLYVKKAGEESLNGQWKGHEMNNTKACPPGQIYLSKQNSSVFPVSVDQDDSLASLQQTMKIQPREAEVVKELVLDAAEVKIELFDNAEIDDDTVSVFLNNTLLLYKKRLTDKPLTMKLDAFPGAEYQIMMYAENLGRIPPNTALMVISAGQQKYELRVSANEQKNAVVKFKLRDR